MTSTSRQTLRRGLAAGAVGSTALNVATYLDMAVSGRPASSAPADTVSAALRWAGVSLPASSDRREAYGALSGLGAGLAVGVITAVARRVGIRLPGPLAAVVTGAAALAASDVPLALLGVDDPRSWTAQSWARDIGPHLAYGIGVRWTLDHLEARDTVVVLQAAEPAAVDVRHSTRLGLLTRSLVLGIASGGRSSLGMAAAAAVAGHPRLTLAGGAGVAAELVADKLPSTPSRAEPGPTLFRAAAGALGATALAHADSAPVLAPAVVGALGAGIGTVAGATWRELAARRGSTWQAALVEDAVVLALTAWAVRGHAGPVSDTH